MSTILSVFYEWKPAWFSFEFKSTIFPPLRCFLLRRCGFNHSVSQMTRNFKKINFLMIRRTYLLILLDAILFHCNSYFEVFISINNMWALTFTAFVCYNFISVHMCASTIFSSARSCFNFTIHRSIKKYLQQTLSKVTLSCQVTNCSGWQPAISSQLYYEKRMV